MSLVVLGLFSFRDLGVDLFPRADPATVNVRCRCPAPARRARLVGHRADGAGDQRRVGHRRDLRAHSAKAAATSPCRFVLERDLDRR
jgi:hypothetical protein